MRLIIYLINKRREVQDLMGNRKTEAIKYRPWILAEFLSKPSLISALFFHGIKEFIVGFGGFEPVMQKLHGANFIHIMNHFS